MSKKISSLSNLSASLSTAQQHYNHQFADKFYKHIWAGDDIFIGLGCYEGDDTPETIAIACQRMVDKMARLIVNHQPDNVCLLDLGAGYGATARYLARQYGFRVDCLNLSETQNIENIRLNQEQGLDDKIRVFHGNFESLAFANNCYHVVWSQDSFLHSDNRPVVLSEIDRVLKPGGHIIFSDILQADSCPAEVLQSILARFGLKNLATQSFYNEHATKFAWKINQTHDISSDLVAHYLRVMHELDVNYNALLKVFEADYLIKLRQGIGDWIDAGEQEYLKWGLFHFKKVSKNNFFC